MGHTSPCPRPPQAGPPEESRKSNSTMGPYSPRPAHLSFPPSSRKLETFLLGTGPQLVWPVPELLFSGWGGHVVQGSQSQCPWHWATGIGPSRANQRPSLGVSIRPPAGKTSVGCRAESRDCSVLKPRATVSVPCTVGGACIVEAARPQGPNL